MTCLKAQRVSDALLVCLSESSTTPKNQARMYFPVRDVAERVNPHVGLVNALVGGSLWIRYERLHSIFT